MHCKQWRPHMLLINCCQEKHNFLRKNEIKVLKMIFSLHLYILIFLFDPCAIFRQIKAHFSKQNQKVKIALRRDGKSPDLIANGCCYESSTTF